MASDGADWENEWRNICSAMVNSSTGFPALSGPTDRQPLMWKLRRVPDWWTRTDQPGNDGGCRAEADWPIGGGERVVTNNWPLI